MNKNLTLFLPNFLLLISPFDKNSAEKPILVNDVAASTASSVLLGFGIVFLFLAVGLYV